MRSRTFAGRNLRHHNTERLAMKTDAWIDNISHAAHSRWFEDQIFLFHEYFALTPQLFFLHGEGHLFRVQLTGSSVCHFTIANLPAASGDEGFSRVFSFLSVDPEFWIPFVLVDRLAQSQ